VVGVERDGSDYRTVRFAKRRPQRLSLQYAQLGAVISRSDVEHVARLSRLALSEAEIERMREQLSGILAYIDTLAHRHRRRRADLHAMPLVNVMRDDELRPCLPGRRPGQRPRPQRRVLSRPRIIED